jgi:hypothetical protein
MSENATAPTNSAAQLSDDEINALADAARALSPGMRFVGRPLNFGWEKGTWYWKPDREHEEKVGATEAFAIDLRGAGEAWKRWGRMDNGKVGIVDQIGGRYVDGWRNPPRHAMPEANEDLPASDDPWKESSSLVLKRLSDDQLLTWSAVYSSREGMGEFLAIAAKDWRDHIGCMPLVLLESAPDGKNFKPRSGQGCVPAGAAQGVAWEVRRSEGRDRRQEGVEGPRHGRRDPVVTSDKRPAGDGVTGRIVPDDLEDQRCRTGITNITASPLMSTPDAGLSSIARCGTASKPPNALESS